MRYLFFIFFLSCASLTYAQETSQKESPAIQDNSFLIEEAYNQEAGVVQHINTFMRLRGGDWVYTFTQELPFISQKHQLSYTLVAQKAGSAPDGGRGLGDVLLNYRYQLIGDGNAKVAVSPRFSVLLPTGSVRKGLGAGAPGVQVNLPVSVVLSRNFVTHWNAGATYTRAAKNALGEKAATTGYNLGQSLVWLARPRFNALLETAWNSSETVIGNKQKTRDNTLFINPGVRWAHNFHSVLQIVPGISVPLGVGTNKGERAIFFYLSFEHPFKKRSE